MAKGSWIGVRGRGGFVGVLMAVSLGACGGARGGAEGGFIGTWQGSGSATGTCDNGNEITLTLSANGTFTQGVSGGLVWNGRYCTFRASDSGDVATGETPATCMSPDASTGGMDITTYSTLTWTLSSPTEIAWDDSATVQFTANGATLFTCTVTGTTTLTKLSN